MKYREAFSEAVQGARVTAPTIQDGAYVDYQFAGLRIVYPSGSNSGFTPTEADEAAEWSIVDDEPKLYMATKGGGKSWGLPRIELGEAGKPLLADWGSKAASVLCDGCGVIEGYQHSPDCPVGGYVDSDGELMPKGQRYARDPASSNVGKPKLTGFELAQLDAKALKEDAETVVDKWGQVAKPAPSKWGPGT